MSEFKDIPQEPGKTIDLTGGRSFGPVEFPGEPIEIRMAGFPFRLEQYYPENLDIPPGQKKKELLGLKGKKPVCVLINPEVFDAQRQTGYVVLYRGERYLFGRYHTYGDCFLYPSDNISRNHLEINVLRDGRIEIRDLNSTNGTTVIIKEQRKAASRVSRVASELASEEVKAREIFEKAGKRTAQEVLDLISKAEQILAQEARQGVGKLGRSIQETKDGRSGNEYFVDGKIAYLPPKGKAVFIGDTHGDSLSTEAIVRQVKFIEEMERGNKDFYLVFLGDYTHRGKNSQRNLEIVFELKSRYPRNVILLMGNHEEEIVGRSLCSDGSIITEDLKETSYVNLSTGERDKIINSYFSLFWKFPNILVTGNGIVAVHGGVPKEDFRNLQTLRNNETFFRQIRWSDPNPDVQEFESSRRGGDTYKFGQKPFERFISRLGAGVMVKSHEPIFSGYEIQFNGKLATIFSTGGESRESHYQNRVDPKFMSVSLTEQISRIDPSRHIVGIRF